MKRYGLAAFLAIAVFTFALAALPKAAPANAAWEVTWKKLHNDNTEFIQDDDGNYVFYSDGSGTVSNDIAYYRTDELYKLKQDGFYLRFTYQEFDVDGDGEPVEQLALYGTSIRLTFCSDPELSQGGARSQFVTRLNPYFDNGTASGANAISKRTEASANYWGSPAGEDGFPLDNWFTGDPYGGEFYADGERENTILFKFKDDGLLWYCLNDFWYTPETFPAGYEFATQDDTWAGGQAQAHAWDGSAWGPPPLMEPLLNELDTANDGAGAYFGFWINHSSNTNAPVIKITAMGSPKAPVASTATTTKTANKGVQTVNLNELFIQPNNDSMAFTATSDSEPIGTITNGVWTYDFQTTGAKEVAFKAISNNANLGTLFTAERSTTVTATYNILKEVTAKNASALNKNADAGSTVSVVDLREYFEADAALTFTADKGTANGNAWSMTMAGTQTVKITATDGFTSAFIEFTLTKNWDAVTAKDATALTKTVAKDTTVTVSDLTAYFTKDSEAGALTFTADKGTVSGNSWSLAYAGGTVAVSITASDGKTNASISFTLTESAWAAVTAKDATALNKEYAKGDTVTVSDLTAYFTKDAAADALTFTANKGTVTGNSWSYVLNDGTQTITITATDGRTDAAITFTVTEKAKSNDCNNSANVLALFGFLAAAFVVKFVKKH